MTHPAKQLQSFYMQMIADVIPLQNDLEKAIPSAVKYPPYTRDMYCKFENEKPKVKTTTIHKIYYECLLVTVFCDFKHQVSST